MYTPYIINRFRGGISDESNKGVNGSFKHGYGLNIHKKNDTLSANQAMQEITPGAMTDLVKYWVPANDGSLYAFGSTGSIWAVNGTDGTWTFAYNDENGEIKGANQWGVSTGLNYMFWATNTSIAVKPLVGNGVLPWTDVTADYKTTLDPADYHTMQQASGALMIANNEFLASFDYDNNFDPSAMNIRPGNLIKCFEERDDYVILGSIRKDNAEEGHIWSWVVTAINWVQKKRIPVKGVNAMIYAEIPLIQGGTDGELFTSDFSDAIPLNTITGQVNPSGSTIYNDMGHFGTYGGDYPGIWSYGRKRKNRAFALNYEYRLSPTVGGSTLTEIGALTTWNDNIYASWKVTDGSTVTYGVDQLSSTTKATAVYEGLEFSNNEPHLEHWYQNIQLRAKPMPSGTSLSAKYKLNNETAWRYAVMGNGLTTHSVSDGYSSTIAEFSIGANGSPYEVGIEINPSVNATPEVESIVTYVSPESKDYA